MPPELVALTITEFVREGFARVGILRGGVAALEPQQREAMAVDDALHVGAGGAQGSAGGVSKLKEEASAKLGQAKEALKSRLSFSRRTRAKPNPI